MTQPEKKTIEEIAAMSAMERNAYFLSLSYEERKAINERELLIAIDAVTAKMIADSLHKNFETNDNS